MATFNNMTCHALQVAVHMDYDKTVQDFLDEGADANAQGEKCGNALKAAKTGIVDGQV